jgi:carboxypeptidase Taq
MPISQEFKSEFENSSKQLSASPYKSLRKSFLELGSLEDKYASLERDKLITESKKEQISIDQSIQSTAASIRNFWNNEAVSINLNIVESETSHKDEERVAMLREMRLKHTISTATTDEIDREAFFIETNGRRIHADAKRTDDWDSTIEWLEKVVENRRAAGQAIADRMQLNSPYDGLLAVSSPGFNSDYIMQYFSQLMPALNEIYTAATNKQSSQTDPATLSGPFKAEEQMTLNRAVIGSMGFDFSRGDIYATPYEAVETGTPDNTGALIKYPVEDNFLISLKSAIHEAWHCIYTQNLPEKYRYTPLGDDLGAIKQESQALLGEMIIGRSPEFFKFVANKAEEIFGQKIDPDNLYKLKTRVEKSLDRKTADEITYHMHIALRTELGAQLMNREIEVYDLPEAWNSACEKYLGIKPKNNSEGILQDVHWFVGKFGNFPSYSIGHAIAAQECYSIRSMHPDIKENIANGDFGEIISWTRDNIHSKGRLFDIQELIEISTGEPLNPQYQISHLQERYIEEKPAPKPDIPKKITELCPNRHDI